MIARSPDAPSGSPVRVRMNPTDKLRVHLVTGSPLQVILFQREGMRPPQIDSKSYELQSKRLGRTRTLKKR